MNKRIAQELREFAKIIADRYSHLDRENNFNKETFSVDHIYPLSDSTATVILIKNTGKKVAAFCYYLKTGWQYWIPTDAHMVGMMAFSQYKWELERENFSFNFIRRDPGEEG